MFNFFPEIVVGDAMCYGGIMLFPLFAEMESPLAYDLSPEAIEQGNLIIKEVSEAGSVPDLLVESKGNRFVLLIEGEELVGARQNRILNTSVLIGPNSVSKIPVSCVESGRWGYKSRRFKSGLTHSPSKLRRVLRASVSHSVRARRGHRSDQRGIWEEVARQQAALCASSQTRAMSDTFAAHDRQLEEYRRVLRYTEGAIGVAIEIGGRLASIDVFDKRTVCSRVWDRMLTGAILDALEVTEGARVVERNDVEKVLNGLRDLPWEKCESVGEGEEYRAESTTGDYASTLVYQDLLVHGSLLCAS